MSTCVRTVGPNDSVEMASTQMRLHKMHHLVVVDGGALVGILSARDLGTLPLQEGTRVGDVMSPRPVIAAPTTTLRRTANLLRGRTIGCLPVVDDGRLVGIVTISDLLEALGNAHERPVQKGKRWVLRGRGPRKRRVPGLHR